MVRALIVSLFLLLLMPAAVAVADSNVTVAKKLTNDNVYIAPSVISAGHANPGDKARLQRSVDHASSKSVAVKVALLTQYPKNLKNPHDAAQHLRTFIDFSGVLVLVSPHGVGVSSDYLSGAATARLEHQATPLCSTGYTACAERAIRASVPEVQAEEATANRSVAVFWAVAVMLFGVLIAVLVLAARHRQQAIIATWGDRGGDPTSVSPPSGTA